MKGHVTTERTKKSIKVQELFSVLAVIFGFLALFAGIIGENGFLFVLGFF